MDAKKLNQSSGVQIDSWEGVDYYISEIRDKEVQALSLQRNYDDEVLKLQKKFQDPRANLMDEVNFIKGKIKTFCDSKRGEMDGGKKKVLTNGEVFYRDLPIKLKLMDSVTEDSVIDKIMKLGKKFSDKYLRKKTEIDLNSLKKEYTQKDIDAGFLKKIGFVPEKGESFSVKANP